MRITIVPKGTGAKTGDDQKTKVVRIIGNYCNYTYTWQTILENTPSVEFQ